MVLREAVSESAAPPGPGLSVEFGRDRPFKLDSGAELGPFTVAYQTYGKLNAAKSNAVLVCHALSGDQYVTGGNPQTGREGWWEPMVGPGLTIDTERYFVLCANVLGGCMGTAGPKEINPATGEVWGLSFPVITVADMVRAQKLLID
ncbi:MAG TPA: homoserine O-acetyltransferase, partial [Alphaproteobacteria bacterium]|nr:homoserine O-acetyltransferase [Alphaproteobacteria bacterium]